MSEPIIDWDGYLKKLKDIEEQRNALLAACEVAYVLHYPNPDDPDEIERLSPLDKKCKKKLKAALALAKKGK